VLRLLLLALPSPARAVQDGLANDAKLLLARAPHGNANAVVADAAHAAAAHLLEELGGAQVRTRDAFGALVAAARPRFDELTRTTVDRTLRVLRTAAAVERNISRTSSLALVPSLADVREQFTGLVHAGFVAQTGVDRLPDLLRYLQGIDRRLATMPDNPQRDRVRMAEFTRVRDAWRAAVRRAAGAGGGQVPPDLARLRWTLEELRLQKFAQGVPTAHPVSDERVLKALAEFG
jgi:ATP-dependent helicase HrpA